MRDGWYVQLGRGWVVPGFAACLIVIFIVYTTRVQISSSMGIEYQSLIQLAPLRHGAMATASFPIRNQTGQGIILQHFRSSCACEKVGVRQNGRLIPPENIAIADGHEVEVQVSFTANGRYDRSVHITVFVTTDHPSFPELKIAVTASIIGVKPLTDPSSIRLGTVMHGESWRQRIQLFDVDSRSRKINVVVPKGENLLNAIFLPQVDSVRSDEVGRGFPIGALDVELKATSTESFEGEIQLYLDDDTADPLRLPLSYRVAAPIEVYPPVLYLPRATSKGFVYAGICLCKSSIGVPLRLEVASRPHGVQVEILPSDKPGAPVRQVRVTLAEELIEYPFTGWT